MTPETLFQLANPMALLGWVALFFSPLFPRISLAAAGLLVPLLLSVGYTALMLVHWTSASGGFNSLQAVAQLMESRWLLLAGWVHYLAFDLLVGAWEVKVARREAIGHWCVMPCLALTFLFGPAGYLAFQAVRASRRHLANGSARTAPQRSTNPQDHLIDPGSPA